MRRALGVGLMLAAGLAGNALAQVTTRYDGDYVGELVLTNGTKTSSGNCTEPPLGALYPLKISGGVVRFVYMPRFDTRLVGRIADNGNFTASARIKHGSIQMTGRIAGNKLTASIVSPSCNYTFQTKN
jgi:hypothetical protein